MVEEMKDLIKTIGKDSFKREILHICFNKSSMSYLETKEIFVRDALLRDDYINRWCTCQINGNNLKGLYANRSESSGEGQTT